MASSAREPELRDEPAGLVLEEIRIGHRTVIAVAGDIDIATVETLQQAVERALVSGAADVWLDLSDVDFMDSTGLRVVLGARTALRRRKKRLAVICPPGPVHRVLEIAGLDDRLTVYPDRAAAHAAG
jgi:anti-sigma B factor antagonist